MSEPDQIDPEALTRFQAGSLFQSKVAERQRNSGDDLIKAWATVRILNPKLFARMGVHDETPDVAHVQGAGRYSDSSGIIKGPTPPLPYTASGAGKAGTLASKLMPRRPVPIPNEGSFTDKVRAILIGHGVLSSGDGDDKILSALMKLNFVGSQ